MKRLLIYLIFAYACWMIWQRFAGHQANVTPTPQWQQTAIEEANSRLPAYGERMSETPQFKCDGRQYCSQMRSRAEAEFFLRHCPNVKMDGDHDGIPCERDSRW
ncbi:excalibur calcium-binding domain-containing protein [Shewanella dokdonensis]|nr:excalibur calcium-binding domain-containing protein [Shewanella dokdonensis]MCL1075675.1 excalibur calcium-binding domain-containing protein [Shewanella dokdonensis]